MSAESEKVKNNSSSVQFESWITVSLVVIYVILIPGFTQLRCKGIWNLLYREYKPLANHAAAAADLVTSAHLYWEQHWSPTEGDNAEQSIFLLHFFWISPRLVHAAKIFCVSDYRERLSIYDNSLVTPLMIINDLQQWTRPSAKRLLVLYSYN